MVLKADIADKGVVVRGYHGTSFAAASSIRINGFKPSEGDKQWLGEGVYFFQDSPEHAHNWGRNVKNLMPKNIVVLRADLNLGRCLDLLHNPDHQKLLENYFNEAENRIHKKALKSKKYFQDDISITDAAVINLISEISVIDSIRTSYSSDKPIFYGSKFFKDQHIIICMRNLDNISNVEMS